EFEFDQNKLHKLAYSMRKLLSHGGLLKFVHGGDYHAFNPDVVCTLKVAVRSGNYEDYRLYADLVTQRPVTNVRDMFAVNTEQKAIAIY
ncbi:hypothetical protein CWB96_23105, partial [Pseudoalteromonas citrea]